MTEKYTNKKYTWHKIAVNHIELFEDAINDLKAIEVAGRKITIGLYKDNIFATAHKCPHAGGVLADGFIDAAGNIVCPLHRYRFSLQNGRNISGEGYYLKTWPVETRTDGIYIGLEEGGIFGWLK